MRKKSAKPAKAASPIPEQILAAVPQVPEKPRAAAHDAEKIKMRVQIENVQPKFSGGRFPIKRIAGDKVKVEADIFVDGHNQLSAVLMYRKEGQEKWTEVPMEHSVNDRWSAEFKVPSIGRWDYTIQAWVDDFKSWQRDFKKRVDAAQEVEIDVLIGLALIQKALLRASARDKDALNRITARISDRKNKAEANSAVFSDELSRTMARCPDRTDAASYRVLSVIVDPEIARFSAWYELFPRSWGRVPGKHGTFRDVIAKLPYIAGMGFNVLYLPPVHPVGLQFRKGKNNSVRCEKNDVGSPWAIGNKDGGHKSINPDLGTMEDFHELIKQAGKLGLTVALDIAYQCSPDHPYVKEHPEWFRMRPDNTIQYAENPPKKYQDIYPMNFENENWQGLWDELKSVITFWIGHGVRIFRVDNPHTKDLSFWEWMIAGVKKEYPEVIFLSEAFTRPKLMYRLAKLGFSQSYTYFAWRNVKWELTQYFTELTTTEVKEYFRPNLWPNTPDILNAYLQEGGANAFKIRYLLAATLGSNYGIYGPAFELCVNKPFAPNSEEYLNSEKYEIKKWDLESKNSIRPLITNVNKIRNTNRALQRDNNIEFLPIDNDQLLCFAKYGENLSEILVVVVNLDPKWTQTGWLEIPMHKFGIPDAGDYSVYDLLDGSRYSWNGAKNFVKLDPEGVPAHIFKIR